MTEAKLIELIDKYDIDAISMFELISGIELFADLKVAEALEKIEQSLPSDEEINNMLPLKPTDGTESTVIYNTSTILARGGSKMVIDKTQEAINKIKE